jgi:hypothetical protein
MFTYSLKLFNNIPVSTILTAPYGYGIIYGWEAAIALAGFKRWGYH